MERCDRRGVEGHRHNKHRRSRSNRLANGVHASMGEKRSHGRVSQHRLLRGPRRDADVRWRIQVARRLLQRPQRRNVRDQKGLLEQVEPPAIHHDLAAKGDIDHFDPVPVSAIEPFHDIGVLRALRHGGALHGGMIVHAGHDGELAAQRGVSSTQLRQAGHDQGARLHGLESIGLPSGQTQPHAPRVVHHHRGHAQQAPKTPSANVERKQPWRSGNLLAGVPGAEGGLQRPWYVEDRHPHLRAECKTHGWYARGLRGAVHGVHNVGGANHIRLETLQLRKCRLGQRPAPVSVEEQDGGAM
mmetsp:Transcript_30651/g.88880  ORF Transcript_30651/g.88880 Transcript_30651/m.88880 type:complete len:300 (+) Transcript_30651:472-1371(+)